MGVRPKGGPRVRALLVALGLLVTGHATACLVSLNGLTGGGSSDAGDAGLAPAAAPSATATATPVNEAGPNEPDAGADNDSSDATIASAAAPLDDASSASDGPSRSKGGPLGLGAPTSSSPTIGGDSGVPFSATCPAGAALVGLNLVADPESPFALLEVQGLCSEITLLPSGELAFAAPAPLALEGKGDGAGTAGTLACPEGSVVVGISATAENFVHAVLVACAELLVTSDVAGAPLALGAGTLVGPFGGSGGNPVPSFQCPSPSLVNALAGSAGGSGFVNSLILGCATPSSP